MFMSIYLLYSVSLVSLVMFMNLLECLLSDLFGLNKMKAVSIKVKRNSSNENIMMKLNLKFFIPIT